jgi:hypothetical protein
MIVLHCIIIIRLPVPGSSGRCDATPKDDGKEEEGLRYEERIVKWIAAAV